MQLFYVIEAVVCLTVAFIYWLLPSLSDKTLAFGARIPVERASDPSIAHATRIYRLLLLISVLVAAAATWAFVMAGASTIAIAISPLILVALATFGYYVAHRLVRRAKEQGNWYSGLREGMVAEVAEAQRATFPYAWAALPLLVIVATAVILVRVFPTLPATLATHFDFSGQANGFSPRVPGAFLPVISELFVTLLIGGVAFFIPKYRHTLDPSDPQGSAERGRIFQRRWMRALMVIAALTNLTQLYSGLIIWQVIRPVSIMISITSLVPAFAIIVLVVALALNTGQAGARLRTGQQGKATGLVYRDDDTYWKAGLFYFNRDDPSLFVERRFGVGWTLNMARPVAWILLVAVAALIIVSIVLLPHHPR